MAWQFGVGVIAIILLVMFFIPTVDTLSIVVTIPPDQNNVNVIPSRITLYQSFTLNFSNVPKGTNEVRITLNRTGVGSGGGGGGSGGALEHNESYYIGQGTWTINTLQPISKGDVVNVTIPLHNFSKVIAIG